MSNPIPHRGEVWLADVDKRRPVVIMTRDPMGGILRQVIVAPITSTVRDIDTEVGISQEEGLRHDSVVQLDGTQLVDRGDLIRKVGQVRPDTMARICFALHIAIGCD